MLNKKHTYAFILGKNPTLSIAELLFVLKREHFVFVILSISTQTLIIKTQNRIKNPQQFLNHLGGTIKIGKIVQKIKKGEIEKNIVLFAIKEQKNKKFIFGFSFYNFKDIKPQEINQIGLKAKQKLKNNNISSRFVPLKHNPFLSAPEVINNKILQKGKEFIFIKMNKEILWGETLAIQNFQSYSFRDYGRPKRNPKQGMLPPKLAQIMINLLPYKPEAINHKLIYDPFCGNGTILSEAILMNYSVLGSDINPQAIADAKENLKWLQTKYDLEIPHLNQIIFQADAIKIKENQLFLKPYFIVSELYLGPPLSKTPNKKQLEKITKDLKNLYLNFLKNIYENFPSVKSLVIAIPFYTLKAAFANKQTTNYQLPIIDQIKNIGYNIIDPLEGIKINKQIIPQYDDRRKTILYSRKNQIVGREIIVIAKIKN